MRIILVLIDYLSEDYTVRWFSEDDLPFFIDGLNKTLWDAYNREVFDWKFVNNPFNLGFTSIITVEHRSTGTPVAFNSFLPMPVKAGDNCFTALQGCDGFVDQDHRRKGLFQLTIKFLEQEIIGLTPDVLISFNLVRAAAAARKAGSEFTCDINRLTLNSTGYRERGKEQVLLEPIDVSRYYELYREWAEDSNLIHFERKKEYLNWRINKHPVRDQHPYAFTGEEKGYVVVDLVKEETGVSMTINDYSPNIMEEHFPEILDALMEAHPKVTSVDLIARAESSLNKVAKRVGFEETPIYTVIMMGLNNARHELGRVYVGDRDISDKTHWLYTSSDVY